MKALSDLSFCFTFRELLWTLSCEELCLLEKSLCNMEEPAHNASEETSLDEQLSVDAQLYHAQNERKKSVGHQDNNDDTTSSSSSSSSSLSSSSSSLPCTSTDATSNEPNKKDTSTSNKDSRTSSNDTDPSNRDPSNTVVSDNLDPSDNESSDISDRLCHGSVGASVMVHQESTDSGMLSETELAQTGGTSTLHSPILESAGAATTRRLHHSRSWPEGRSERGQAAAAADGGDDVLEADAGLGDEVQRPTFTHHHGSHQFNFHLPLNTQRENIGRPSSEATPEDYDRLMYVQSQSTSSQHVAFVTEALTDLCLMEDSSVETIPHERLTVVDTGNEEHVNTDLDSSSSSNEATLIGESPASRDNLLLDREIQSSTQNRRQPRSAPHIPGTSSCSHSLTESSSVCSSDGTYQDEEEEIALAIQAAELTARKQARSKFKSSDDLIHRLFVCVSGE